MSPLEILHSSHSPFFIHHSSFTKMETIDMIIAGVFLLGAIQGFIKGLVRQVASLVGLIAGLLIARALFGVVGEYLAEQMGTSVSFGQILAFILIWVIVPIGFSIIAYMLTKTLELIKLGFLNRWLGSGLGAVKYLLVASLFIQLVEFIDSKNELIAGTTKEASAFYYPLEKFSGVFMPALKTVTNQLIDIDKEI